MHTYICIRNIGYMFNLYDWLIKEEKAMKQQIQKKLGESSYDARV
jgi:hypothetical protein